MAGREGLIKQLAEFKQRLGKSMQVSKILLFRSLAEGQANEDSDVDLIIVSDAFNKQNFMQRSAKMYYYWTARLPVDFLCYTPKEFNALSKKVTIVSHALKHGISI